MPVQVNLGFETIGPRAGFADRWYQRSRVLAEAHAGWARTSFTPLTSPAAFDAAEWTTSNLTVTPNTGTAPDGTATADALADSAVNAVHTLRRTAATAFVAGRAYTFGFFARRNTHTHVGVYFDLGAGNAVWSTFDVSTGGGGTSGRVQNPGTSIGSISKVASEIIDVGDGWYLCATTVLFSANATVSPAIALFGTATGAPAYVGSGTSVWVWNAFLYEGGLVAAEDFEAAWGNTPFLSVIAASVDATFVIAEPVPEPFEAFEELWGNTPYYTQVVGTAAGFSTAFEVAEDLEEEWLNSPYYVTVPGPVVATFDTEAAEDLEEAWDTGYAGAVFPVILVDPAPNAITTAQPHGLTDGAQVTIASTVTLPVPLAANVAYFVLISTPSIVRLALTLNGSAIDITTSGSGAITLGRVLPTRAIEFTVNAGTDVVTTSVPHGLVEATAVRLVSTHTLPAPLSAGTTYYVIYISPTTFTLSLTPGGAVVNISNTGTGTHGFEVVRAGFRAAALTELFEPFEPVVRDRVFTVVAATDVFTSAAHGFVVNDQLLVLSPSGGEIPGGLNPTITYFVIAPTANTFQLALTAGGAAVDVTSTGVGTQRVRAHPSLYWNELDFNPTM